MLEKKRVFVGFSLYIPLLYILAISNACKFEVLSVSVSMKQNVQRLILSF